MARVTFAIGTLKPMPLKFLGPKIILQVVFETANYSTNLLLLINE